MKKSKTHINAPMISTQISSPFFTDDLRDTRPRAPSIHGDLCFETNEDCVINASESDFSSPKSPLLKFIKAKEKKDLFKVKTLSSRRETCPLVSLNEQITTRLSKERTTRKYEEKSLKDVYQELLHKGKAGRKRETLGPVPPKPKENMKNFQKVKTVLSVYSRGNENQSSKKNSGKITKKLFRSSFKTESTQLHHDQKSKKN